jgi:protease YdgD
VNDEFKMKQLWIIATVLLLAAATAQAASPALPPLLGPPPILGVGPRDPRVPVNVNQPPWRALVRVQTAIGARCTGVLIEASVALTAAHCLLSPRTHVLIPPDDVHVVSGYALGNYTGHAVVVSYSVAPGFDPQRGLRTAGADWAVLRLSAPLGTLGHTLPVARRPVAIGTRVMLAGFGQDRAEELAADLSCTVTGWSTDADARPLIEHSCSATSGTSGAPLLARTGYGGWAVIGLQEAATRGIAGGQAVPLSATLVPVPARQ